jgi:hypothetical protein
MEPDRVRKFEKKVNEVGDDGLHLMSYLKEVIRKITK